VTGVQTCALPIYISVYRVHNSATETFDKLTVRPTSVYEDGKYYIGDGFIVMYTNKFSTYGIGYTVKAAESDNTAEIISIILSQSRNIAVETPENGKIRVSAKTAYFRDSVTVTVTPDDGYRTESVTAVTKSGKTVKLTKVTDTKYTFTVGTSDVTVSATFVKDASVLVDVTEESEYYDAISNCNSVGNSNCFIEFVLNMIDKVLDDVLEQIAKSNAETSEYVKRLLGVMEYGVPYTALDIMKKLNLKSRETFRKNYMNPAIDMGMVRMTIPNKPNSKNQRYVKV